MAERMMWRVRTVDGMALRYTNVLELSAGMLRLGQRIDGIRIEMDLSACSVESSIGARF
jgi:hypothetical protein